MTKRHAPRTPRNAKLQQSMFGFSDVNETQKAPATMTKAARKRTEAVREIARKIHTSDNFPLRVDYIQSTRIGMTFAPGKKGLSPVGKMHNRDLETDLYRIVNSGATMLVTIMETKELIRYNMENLKNACERLGLKHMQVSVEDMHVPKDPKSYRKALLAAQQELSIGGTVVVHCLGGLGRTGTFAACLLQDTESITPEQSILAVRDARPGTIQTRLQEAYVILHSYMGQNA